MNTQHDTERDAAIREIAKRETPFESLTPTRSGADFREVAVWTIEQALTAAYEAGSEAVRKAEGLAAAYEAGRDAGRKAERKRRTPTQCQCPACGREIRITPVT